MAASPTRRHGEADLLLAAHQRTPLPAVLGQEAEHVVDGDAVAGVAVAPGDGGGGEHRVQHGLLGRLDDPREVVVEGTARHRGRPLGVAVAVQSKAGAEAHEDLAAAVVCDGARAREPESDASSEPDARGPVDRGVGHHDADARPSRRGRALRRRAEQTTHRDTGHDALLADPEVGHEQDRDGVLADPPRRRTDAALEVETGHARPGPDGTLVGRDRRADGGAGGLPRSHHVLVLGLHAAGVVEPGVVALGHHRDDEVHRGRGVVLELDPTGRVVDAAQLQGRGEVDRRLGAAPLRGGEEPRALAGAVEDSPARRDGAGEGVVGEDQHGRARARPAATVGGRRLVADDRGVAEADTGDVEDGVGRSGRQHADLDAEITNARHPAILPYPDREEDGPVSAPQDPASSPRRLPKHLMDPANPRPVHPRRQMGLTEVQRWVLSVLVVTTIAHMAFGVVAAAFTIEDDRPGAKVAMLVIAAIFGMGAVVAGALIHQKNPVNWFLPLGWIPSAVGAYFLF